MTGIVTIKFETFNEEGIRTNIECFSISHKAFLALGHEYMLNLHQCEQRTKKEILTPTPKTDML